MPAQLVIFEGITLALKEKVFGDDLALIVSEQPNKTQINRLAGETVQIIAETGDYDPLREIITIKRLILYLEEIENRIRPAATVEADKYTAGGKMNTFEKCNAKVRVQKTKDEWDFDNCNAITKREQKIEALKAEIKAIQTQLKVGNYVDPETGEETEKAVLLIDGTQVPNISITL